MLRSQKRIKYIVLAVNNLYICLNMIHEVRNAHYERNDKENGVKRPSTERRLRPLVIPLFFLRFTLSHDCPK